MKSNLKLTRNLFCSFGNVPDEPENFGVVDSNVEAGSEVGSAVSIGPGHGGDLKYDITKLFAMLAKFHKLTRSQKPNDD